MTSNSLITALSYVDVDSGAGQLRWIVRFLSTRAAPGPTQVRARVQVTALGQPLQVVGYELVEPDQSRLNAGDPVIIPACGAASLMVHTAGALIEGIATYEISIEDIRLPEGGTVTEVLSIRMACSKTGFSCTPLR